MAGSRICAILGVSVVIFSIADWHGRCTGIMSLRTGNPERGSLSRLETDILDHLPNSMIPVPGGVRLARARLTAVNAVSCDVRDSQALA
jgi:hypothetical protein